MAKEAYEKALVDAGFQLVDGAEALTPPYRPYGSVSRETLVAGRREVNGAVVEVQLQRTWVYNRSGMSGVARIKSPRFSGDGALQLSTPYSVIRAFISGPKLAVAILVPLMLAGVWAVMLPGIFLVWLITRAIVKRQGKQRFKTLEAPSTGWRYETWGTDLEAARTAWPAERQDVITAAQFPGFCDVKDGALMLSLQIGWGRVDLFQKLLTATAAAAQG